MGAQAQATALADRAAVHVPLDDPYTVGWLLHSLRAAGTEAQVTDISRVDGRPRP